MPKFRKKPVVIEAIQFTEDMVKAHEAPLLCSCPQREYPHDLSIHGLIRSEWWSKERRTQWPWSLMGSLREEPSTERKAA